MSVAATEFVGSGQSLMDCLVCSTRLPLRIPSPDEKGERFRCIKCGSSFVAVFVPDAPPPLLGNVRRDQPARTSLWMPGDPSGGLTVATPRGTATSVPAFRDTIIRPLATPLTRQIDEEIDSGDALAFSRQGTAFLGKITPRGAEAYDAALWLELGASMEVSAAQMGELLRGLLAAQKIDVGDFSSLAHDSIRGATEDLDLFFALGINVPEGKYPFRHSLHVAMLAMAIGATLALDEQTLVEMGMGCLLHDAGMMRVDHQLHEKNRELQLSEFTAIVRHPIHTFNLLEQHLDAVPTNARMVAYQMHERCNGSGYPRGRNSETIHPLAKVAAVADVYVALVSTRPHRDGMIPYHAVRLLLEGARDGLYDSAVVRALVQTVSLFPLGSSVELSDGRVGRVIRSNGTSFDRPVVEVQTYQGRRVEPHLIDLTRELELKVIRAVASAV